MTAVPKITSRVNNWLLLLLVLVSACKDAPKTTARTTAVHVHDTVFLAKEKRCTTAPLISNELAIISADEMNILYIGTNNPVSVAIPGILSNQIHISVSNGSYTGSKGHYNLKVTSVGETKIIAFTKTATGQRQNVSTTIFNARRMPDPKVKFAGQNGGTCSYIKLKVQDVLFASWDSYYGIDAHFTIVNFTLFMVKPAQEAVTLSTKGYELSAEMKAALATIVPGTVLVFKDIVVACADGSKRPLDPIVFTAD